LLAETPSGQLIAHTEYVLESLLGEPNKKLSSKREYRYGSNGSLSCCLDGEKRGTWFNFETGEKGNLFHLIQKTLNLNFKQSLEYAAKLTGEDINTVINHERRVIIKNNSQLPSKNKTQKYAEQLAKESIPLSNTPAAKYLKETRGIHNLKGNDIRFHPKVWTNKEEKTKYRPALISIARDKENSIKAVEVVYLDPKSFTKAKMEIKSKKSFGSKKGNAVILNEGKNRDSVTYLTEGVETGLSVRDAVSSERVLAVLGKSNFATIDMGLLTNKVVLCVDNDGKAINKDEKLLEAIERLKANGKEVLISVPKNHNDFNDLARNDGFKAVVETLKNASSDIISNLQQKPLSANLTSMQIEQSIKSINQKESLKIPADITTKEIQRDRLLHHIEREIY